jgi:preprotein translocase subunit YajC
MLTFVFIIMLFIFFLYMLQRNMHKTTKRRKVSKENINKIRKSLQNKEHIH